MSGSLLRLVSFVLLLVVGSLSTGRALCVLPCLTDSASTEVASSAHCVHPASDPGTAIAAHAGACDMCDEAGIDSADRLSLRSSLMVWLTASASVSVDQSLPQTFSLDTGSGPPPGLRTSIAASLPLRI